MTWRRVVPQTDWEHKKMGLEVRELTGKPKGNFCHDNVCLGCSEKQKLKSGKYVKTNVEN